MRYNDAGLENITVAADYCNLLCTARGYLSKNGKSNESSVSSQLRR